MILSWDGYYFFLISTACFTLGLLILVLLLILKKQSGDAGTWTLLMPIGLLTFITLLEVVSYYLFYRYPGQPFRIIALIYEWARIAIAFSWTYIAYFHYHLNKADRMRRGELSVSGGFSALLMLLAPIAVARNVHRHQGGRQNDPDPRVDIPQQQARKTKSCNE